MSDEITAKLLAMTSEISEAVHKTQQDIAVLKAQQEERKEMQEKVIAELKLHQDRQQVEIEELKKSKDRISGITMVVSGIPAFIAAVCALVTVMKH